MSLVVAEGLHLSFAGQVIFADVGLRIALGDRLGLVGPNGSGKTTLLRVLAGEQVADGGEVRRSNGLRLGYLPQDIVLAEEGPLLDFVFASAPGRSSLEQRLEEAQQQVERWAHQDPESEESLQWVTRLADLHEELADVDRQFSRHEAQRILAGLGFAEQDFVRPLGEFSGGWRMRAVLASLLFQKPDLLLLDEPTNHLDMSSVAWFAGFLAQYRGAFILICHDREFLNEQIRRVIAFAPEGVRLYGGNYDAFLRQRAEEEEVLANEAKNVAKKRQDMEKFVERFRAKASKASAVQSRVKMLEKMGPPPEQYGTEKKLRFTFPATARAGADVIRVEQLAKAFGEQPVLSEVDLTVRRGERIGIIGNNGAGKTTLLRIMAAELPCDAGGVSLGHNVRVGYYAQHHADQLAADRTVFEEVYGHSHDAGVTRVRTLLGAFLFSGDDVDKKISVLSGGERARVALAKLLVDPGNVMLMDEPTNHLDLDSSEALGEALATYDGTLVFVSHNRAFVRRLATRIWHVADGSVTTYPGTLDEYMESACQSVSSSAGVARPPTVGSTPASSSVRTGRKRRSRVVDPKAALRRRVPALERRVKELEARIEELEALQRSRSQELEDPKVYGDDEQRFARLTELQVTAEKLEELTERWMGVQGELDQVREGIGETGEGGG